MAHDDVGFPLADQPGQCLAVFQSWHEFAVVVIHHVRFDAEYPGGLPDFAGTPLGQLPPGHDGMTNVPVGGGDEFHLVPQPGPHGGDAAGLEFAVIGMSAKDHDAQLAAASIGPGKLRGGKQTAQKCHRQKCKIASIDIEFFHGCELLKFWVVKQKKFRPIERGVRLRFKGLVRNQKKDPSPGNGSQLGGQKKEMG